MSEPGDLRWQHRIDAAEQAVRGMEGARQRVLDKLPGLAADPTLLGTPDRVALFAYFMALLRELGMDEQRERALQLAHEWIRTKRVPREHRCAVHNRLAALLAEAGRAPPHSRRWTRRAGPLGADSTRRTPGPISPCSPQRARSGTRRVRTPVRRDGGPGARGTAVTGSTCACVPPSSSFSTRERATTSAVLANMPPRSRPCADNRSSVGAPRIHGQQKRWS